MLPLSVSTSALVQLFAYAGLTIARLLLLLAGIITVHSSHMSAGRVVVAGAEAVARGGAIEGARGGEGRVVVVVGGGLAGLAATLEAAQNGAHVTLVEKQNAVGGNSAKATSGINGAGTTYQKERGVEDSQELLRDDTLKSGKGLSTPDLVEVLSSESASAIAWLSDKGLDLAAITQLGGHSRPRTHRIPPTPDGKPLPVGWTIISTLRALVEKDPMVDMRTSTLVTELLIHQVAGGGGEVIKGVRCVAQSQDGAKTEQVMDADAVVLTAGGYAFDDGSDEKSVLAEFAREKRGLPTTNGPQATGDGVKLGRSIGAELVDMGQVQIHPTGFVDPKDRWHKSKILAPEALRGCGGILVDGRGQRFVDELQTRDHVTQRILERCPGQSPAGANAVAQSEAIMLLNDEAADAFGRPPLGFYMSKGLVRRFGSAAEACAGLLLPDGSVEETMHEYGRDAHAGSDAFGKRVFPVTSWDPTAPVYAAIITPCIHYTMGGLRIDTRARVLQSGNKVIGNLYAAGEVTGGVHGANRLGGNSLLECVVYGRIAGRQAATAELGTT